MLGEQLAAIQHEWSVVDTTRDVLPDLADVKETDRWGAGAVVLHPLAEVEVRVLMPVMVRFGELMVYAERHAEGRHHQHGRERRKGDQSAGSQRGSYQQETTLSSKRLCLYHRVFNRVNLQRNCLCGDHRFGMRGKSRPVAGDQDRPSPNLMFPAEGSPSNQEFRIAA